MNVKSLKLFCDVVGRRSFSQAAAENGMTQSGVSQIVHQLEDSLGVRLIDRSKRPFLLTAEGELYYEGCRKLVQRYGVLEEQVRALHRDIGGRVAIASIYSIGLSYGRPLVEGFTARYPKAAVSIEYHHPDRVYELVAGDRVQLGLVSYAQATRLITSAAWFDEPMALVCAAGHPLANRKRVVRDDLQGLEIVGFDRELSIRRHIDRQLAEYGIEVQVTSAFDNIDTIKHAIVVSAGASFLPEPTVQGELAVGDLVAVPVEGLQMVRPLGIIYRRAGHLGATARRFVQYLEQTRFASPRLEVQST